MATIVKSIGTGPGRDYSTIVAWEADLDNATIYASGDDAVGELYADSDFNESFNFDGGTTIGLSSATLRPADGHEHQGVPGAGVVIRRTANFTESQAGGSGTSLTREIVGVEWDLNGFGVTTSSGAVLVTNGATYIRRCIFHDYEYTQNTSQSRAIIELDSGTSRVSNCLIYNCTYNNTSSGAFRAIYEASSSAQHVFGCTVYNIVRNSGSGLCVGISLNGATNQVRNNAVFNMGGTSSGSKVCFGSGTVSADHNASSDATAVMYGGPKCIGDLDAADQFVDPANGDFNLKPTSALVDAGEDLGTTANRAHIDITGYNRDLSEDPWDIGAYEYIAPDSAEGSGEGGIELDGEGAGFTNMQGSGSQGLELDGEGAGFTKMQGSGSQGLELDGTGSGPAAFVQQGDPIWTIPTPTTISIENVTAGNSLIVLLGRVGAGYRAHSATSDRDGAFTPVVESGSVDPSYNQQILVLHNASAGKHVISIARIAGSTDTDIQATVIEVTDLDPNAAPIVSAWADPLDTNTHHAAQEGEIDTDGPTFMVVAGYMSGFGSSVIPGSGWTRLAGGHNTRTIWLYRESSEAEVDQRGTFTRTGTARIGYSCIAAFPRRSVQAPEAEGSGSQGLELDGTGSGSAAYEGSGSVEVVFEGVGAGKAVHAGYGVAGIELDGEATGEHVASGSGELTLELDGVGIGGLGSQGYGSQTLEFSGEGSGISHRSGSAEQIIEFDGAATGKAEHRGAGESGITLDGVAEGKAEYKGHGSEQLALDGSGVGYTINQGYGQGGLTLGGTGAGKSVDRSSGFGSAEIEFSGTGEGIIQPVGHGEGSLELDGEAIGAAALQGAGAETVEFSGTGVGKTEAKGYGELVLAFGAEGEGEVSPHGHGEGSLVFEGTGLGLGGAEGAGVSTILFGGTGAGRADERVWYLSVHAVQPPIDLGPDGAGRTMYVFNLLVRKSPSTTTAEELAQYLVENGISVPMFVSLATIIPQGPGPYISLIMTAGVQPNRTHSRLGSFISRPGLQIIIRGADTKVVEKLARRVHYLLAGIRNQELKIPSWAA